MGIVSNVSKINEAGRPSIAPHHFSNRCSIGHVVYVANITYLESNTKHVTLDRYADMIAEQEPGGVSTSWTSNITTVGSSVRTTYRHRSGIYSVLLVLTERANLTAEVPAYFVLYRQPFLYA